MSGSYHDHDHGPAGHAHGGSVWTYGLFTAAVGILLLLNGLGIFTTVWGFDTALFLAVIAGYKIVYQAMLDLLNRRLSADLAIVVAAVAAVAVGEYFAAAEVMFIMLVGEGIEHYTVDRARHSIAGFVAMTPDTARVRRDGQEVEIKPAEVRSGDTVIIRAGEKVAVDGTVATGHSSVDESMITGEPMPAQKKVGDPVYSGSVNEYGVLEVLAEQVGEDTTLSRIRHLIAEAQRQRAPIEKTADEFAKYFLPLILVAGGAIYFATGDTLRAVAALIVACPCALVLATPAAVAASIARLAREGILVKGGGVIEALARVRKVAFDKTGTLTAGRPTVAAVIPAPGFSEDQVLALAASAEQSSEHLLGREIVAEAGRRELEIRGSEEFVVRPGMGVQAKVNGQTVRVGNLALAKEASARETVQWLESAMASHLQGGQTTVAVMADDTAAGLVTLRDPVRPEAAEAVLRLKEMDLGDISILTGDEESTAQHVGRSIGIGDIHARLLPEDKARKVREWRVEGSRILMVGDGINDSPSLAMADVGLAMGRGAADISAEAAHVIFLKDRLDQIPGLLAFAQKTIQRIRSSIILFAFGVNILAVLGAAWGYLTPVAAAIVHQGSSLLVILNCVRLLIEGKSRESKIATWSAKLRHRIHHFREDFGLSGFGGMARVLAENRERISRVGVPLLLITWLLTAVAVIGPEQVGVVQRFGRLKEVLQPGFHIRWPWPIDRLTRVTPGRVQVVEIGYRSNLDSEEIAEEPKAYEWNTQHRLGRYVKVPEEVLMITGDENLVEVNAVVQYDIENPARFVFAARDPQLLMRAVSERSLRWVLSRRSLDEILTTQRSEIEAVWHEELDGKLAGYDTGLGLLSVRLQDVHPPVEVVEAFRDVASALEEKSTLINQAESYAREQLPLARGQASAQLLSAEAYSEARIERSRGDSARFSQREQAYRSARAVTSLRLYLETVEEVLPNKTKYIADSEGTGRRRFLFLNSEDLDMVNLMGQAVDPRSREAGPLVPEREQ